MNEDGKRSDRSIIRSAIPNFLNKFFSFIASLTGLFGLAAVWQIKRGGSMALWAPFVAGILATFFWFARRFSPETKLNILIALASTLFICYLLEAAMGWYGNPLDLDQARVTAALGSGILYDQRSPIEVARQLSQNGEIAYPFVSPGNFSSADKVQWVDGDPGGERIMPIGGIAQVKTIFCNESGEYAVYQSDKYGFRNPPGIWDGENAGMAIIGDSFAQGACVQDGQHAADLLRIHQPHTINLGVSGAGPIIELAALREYAMPIQAKRVLWFYFEGNDFLDLQDEKGNEFLIQYLTVPTFTQNLMARQEIIDRVRPQFIGAIESAIADSQPSQQENRRKFIALFQLRRLLNLTFTPLNAIDPAASDGGERHYATAIEEHPDNLELMRTIFAAAEQVTANWGSDLVIVYIPAWERFNDPTIVEKSYHRMDMLEIWEELGIEVIDILPAMQSHPDPLSLYPYRLKGHFNPAGYRFLTDIILQQLLYSANP